MLVNVLMVADVIVSIALIITVLLQSGKSAGFSAIGGGSESMFSGKTSDMDEMLAKCTIVLGIAFGVITMLIAKFQ